MGAGNHEKLQWINHIFQRELGKETQRTISSEVASEFHRKGWL